MDERAWDAFLTERDKEVFKAAGYGEFAGFGERPAIVVIDVNYNFTGDKSEPILDSIRRWPNSCGEDAWNALPHIRKLLDAARAKGLPVIYTTGDMREDDPLTTDNERTHHATLVACYQSILKPVFKMDGGRWVDAQVAVSWRTVV